MRLLPCDELLVVPRLGFHLHKRQLSSEIRFLAMNQSPSQVPELRWMWATRKWSKLVPLEE